MRQTFLHHHDPSQAQLALLELSPRRCPYTMVAWDPGSLFGVEPPGLIFLSLLLRLLSSICSGCSPCLVPSSSVHPQLLRDLLILIHTRECSLFSFLPEYSTGKDTSFLELLSLSCSSGYCLNPDPFWMTPRVPLYRSQILRTDM